MALSRSYCADYLAELSRQVNLTPIPAQAATPSPTSGLESVKKTEQIARLGGAGHRTRQPLRWSNQPG
jgi:hypothetical protein